MAYIHLASFLYKNTKCYIIVNTHTRARTYKYYIHGVFSMLRID